MKKRILIQKGHVAPRQPGFESGTGTNGEQEYVTAVAARLATLLKADGRFDVQVIPGKVPAGVKCDVFLSLHCDGNVSALATGYSFGYPGHPVNVRLARLLDEEFAKIPGHPPHHRDNYTADLRGYYGFGRVNTSGPEVLIEHGFLTNPAERAWMNANIGRYAQAEYAALLRYFELDEPAKDATYDVRLIEADGSVKESTTKYPGLVAYRMFVSRVGKRRPRSLLLTKR